MPNPSWQKALRDATTTTANSHTQLPLGRRLAVVGVGNDLRGDDAAGLLVVRRLKQDLPASQNILVIESGSAPENFSGVLRHFKPNLVLFIDAADMGKPAGEIAWIEPDEMDGLSASTHTLPLSVLAEYLVKELGCRVGVIGIQVYEIEGQEEVPYPAPLSPPVAQAVEIISTEILGRCY